MKDWPYPESQPNRVTNEDYLKYLNSYADKFDLWKHIRFETLVTEIRLGANLDLPTLELSEEDKGKKFIVTYIENSSPGTTHREGFDYVIIANGHESKPFLPDIVGRETWDGEQMHSA